MTRDGAPDFLKRPFWIFGVVFAASCTDAPPPLGAWAGHAAIADDQLLPISAHLNLVDDPPSGYFLVGTERTEIPEIVFAGDSLRLVFAEYGAEMAGRVTGDRFAGRYTRFRTDTTSFPFVLFWEPEPHAQSVEARRLSGTYQVYFHYPDRIDSSSVAILTSTNGEVAGTIIHPSGDYGLLEGHFDGTRLRLARFTGWQAIMLDLEFTTAGLEGNLYSRAEPPVPVTFRPAPEDAREHGAITRMRDPNVPFRFAGVTIEGDSVTSEDPRFQGNPIVVDIMGTWCHNCLDAAPLLENAWEEHRDEGLQVVSLSFEITDDFEAARKNIGLFARRFNISFPVLFCGSLAEENVNARLRGQLEDFFSYPTTLFIDRTGKVIDIHTGFNGPGTGTERYQEQMRKFEDAVARIL
ncbi:MAG TPA: TlpA disulfide reductase family protein [Rhodothermales bacterium]|nr:TlpA disulfide reductase family protein [Rhodothermales bacterium]